MENLSGKEFAGLEVEKEIARGGMGIVYKAFQKDMKRPVALKILLPEMASSSRQTKRFVREAKVNSQLRHPNIVQVYGMGKERGLYYFTMQYIPGITFKEYQRENSLRENIQTLVKVCKGVNYAHKLDIVHRDLKPSNILIDHEGEPYIADFGLAKLIDGELRSRLTQTGCTLGTPAYMSPEQVNGDKDLDYRADIYSLGVILYELLTKKRMFEASSFTELSQKVCHELPVLPTEIDPKTSKALENICLKAIAKNPRHRYQQANHMAKDLEDFLAGKKVATGQGAGDILRKWQSRNRRLVIAIMTMTTLCLISLSGLLFHNYLHERQKKQDARNQTKINQAIYDAYENHSYTEAQIILRKALKKFPQAHTLYQALAEVYLHNEEEEKALYCLNKAMKFAPNSPELLFQKSLFHYKAKEFSKAKELLNRYIELLPEKEQGYRQRALVCRELRLPFQEDIQRSNKIATQENKKLLAKIPTLQIKEAIQLLEDAKAKYPMYDKIYITLAQLYRKTHQLELALQNISQAVEINPTSKSTIEKATILFAQEEYEDAWQVLQNLRGELNSADYFLIGKVLLKLEQFAKAMDNLKQALQIASKKEHESIHFTIAKCYYQQNQFSSALQHLEKVCNQENHNEWMGAGLFYRGLAYQKLNNISKAVFNFQESTKHKSPFQYQAYYEVGKIHLKKNNLPEAKTALTTASENLNNSQCFYHLAKCCQLLGKQNLPHNNLGIKAISKAIDLEPWNDKFLYLRSLLHKRLDNWQEFEQDISTCIRLQPRNASYPFQLIQGFIEDEKNAFINYKKTLWLWRATVQNPVIRGIAIPDLFRNENIEQHKKYFQSKQQTEQEWNQEQAKRFLEGYLISKDPTVQEVAFVILSAMYHHQEFRLLLRNKLEQESLSNIRRAKISKLFQHVQQKYYEKSKKKFYRLILRTYASNDREALLEIYNLGDSALEVLQKILSSSENSDFMRFMAAKTLWDLKIPAAREILNQRTSSSDFLTSFYACIASKTYSNSKLPQNWQKEFTPLTRGLIAQNISLEKKDIVQQLLQDEDQRIQLHIAKRLPASPQIINMVVKLIRSSSPEIRHFAIITYWSKISSQKANQQINLWKKLMKDPHAKIRRSISVILRNIQHPEVSKLLYQRVLHDSDYVTRFLSVTGIVTKGNTDEILQILQNSKIPPFLRLSIFFNSSTFSLPPSKLLKITKDRSSTMRTFIHGHLSHAFRNHTMTKGITFSTLKNSPDFHSRLGCLFSLVSMRHHMYDSIDKVEYLLKDKNHEIRFVTAAAILLAAKESYSPQAQDYLNRFLKNKFLRQGAAQGLKILGYDHLFNHRTELPYWNYNFIYEENIRRMMTRHRKPYLFEFQIPYSKHFTEEHALQSIRELQLRGFLSEDPSSYTLLKRHHVKNLKDNKEYQMVFVENRIKIFGRQNEATKPWGNHHIYSHSQKFYLQLFEQLYQLEPNDSENLFALGIQYYLDKKYHKAKEFIEKAIALDPRSFFRLWLAQICYLQKNYRQAWIVTENLNREIPWDYNLVELRIKILEQKSNEVQLKKEQRRLQLLEKREWIYNRATNTDPVDIHPLHISSSTYGRYTHLSTRQIQGNSKLHNYALWQSGQQQNDTIKLFFDLQEEGWYDVRLRCVFTPECGVTEIEFGGKNFSVDFYAKTPTFQEVSLGRNFLKRTENSILFRAIGKKEFPNSNYAFGLEKIILQKTH